MAVLLNDTAWKVGASADEWPRSRYSGAALNPGEMVVTVVVSWKEWFGHAFIAFEWYADELPGPRVLQRRHEVYQLVAQPTDSERARGIENPGCRGLISWRTRPALVVRDTDLEFLPFHNANGEELPAYFRSWVLPFEDGWRARSAAASALGSTPRYHYLEFGGGINCARWVLTVAAFAGIDARHWLSWVVAIPKRLIPPVNRIHAESEMWQQRKA